MKIETNVSDVKLFIYASCVALCAWASACSPQPGKGNQQSSYQTIAIDIDRAQALKTSTLFDTVEYVPLESSDSFLLSGINHLKLTQQQDIYFISDKSFFLFDGKTGQGKTRISRLGNAPEGYISVFDAYLDESAGQIELLDNNGKKVVIYDVSGNYLRSIPLPFMSFMMTKTGPSDYWFYNNNLASEASSCKVVHYDAAQAQIVEEYSPIDQHLAKYFFIEDEKNLIEHPQGLLYMASAVDTIYRIRSGQEMEPAYLLDLGKYKTPKAFYAANYQDIMEFMEASMKHEYVFNFSSLAANEVQMAVACFKQRQPYLTFHSLQKCQSATFASFHDDFHFNAPIPLKPNNMTFCMDADYFYFTLTAEQFMQAQEASKEPDQLEAWMAQKELTEFSNPILVKCKFKKE